MGMISVDLPEHVEELPRYRVRLRVSPEQCLTRRQIRALAGFGIGVRHWWLRHRAGWFVGVDLGRGDEPIDVELELPAGGYVLGVGRGETSIRLRFFVHRSQQSSIRGPLG